MSESSSISPLLQVRLNPKNKKRTKEWDIIATQGDIVLGKVSFRPQWRKYVFHPNMGTLYDDTCLRQIADFCVIETHNWKLEIVLRRIS